MGAYLACFIGTLAIRGRRFVTEERSDPCMEGGQKEYGRRQDDLKAKRWERAENGVITWRSSELRRPHESDNSAMPRQMGPMEGVREQWVRDGPKTAEGTSTLRRSSHCLQTCPRSQREQARSRKALQRRTRGDRYSHGRPSMAVSFHRAPKRVTNEMLKEGGQKR